MYYISIGLQILRAHREVQVSSMSSRDTATENISGKILPSHTQNAGQNPLVCLQSAGLRADTEQSKANIQGMNIAY